jgi:hypothetical protein
MKGKSDLVMKTFEAILKYLGIAMALTYLTTGLLVLCSSETAYVSKFYAAPVGLGLIGYGIFRSYRLFQKYFK